MQRYRQKLGYLYDYVDAFYSYDVFNQSTNSYERGYTHVVCSLCHKAGKEHVVRFDPPVLGLKEVRDAIYPHLADAHSLTSCSHCNSCVTRRGLKNHQKGMECRAAQNKSRLLSEGKKHVSSYRIEGIRRFFNGLADELIYGTSASERADVRLTSLSNYEQTKIRNEANLFAAQFEDIVGLTKEPTLFERGGWGAKRRIETQSWISAEYDRLLELLPGYFWNHNHTEIVARYHERPEERDSIICILEMQNESSNG